MASVEGNVVLAVSHLAPASARSSPGLSYEGTNCACSAGVIHAGTAKNVVPRHALLRGTLRTFTPEQQVEALRRLERLLDEVASAFGVECSLELGEGTPAVHNDAEIAKRVFASAGAGGRSPPT